MKPETPDQSVPWYHERWKVIALIFLALGPFGLPLVYKSPRFSKAEKIIVTVVTVLYTVYLIKETFRIMDQIKEMVSI